MAKKKHTKRSGLRHKPFFFFAATIRFLNSPYWINLVIHFDSNRHRLDHILSRHFDTVIVFPNTASWDITKPKQISKHIWKFFWRKPSLNVIMLKKYMCYFSLKMSALVTRFTFGHFPRFPIFHSRIKIKTVPWVYIVIWRGAYYAIQCQRLQTTFDLSM